ncbi:FAD-dependent oxidoreductase [Demequina sp. SYSU T00039]|uniref:FAD-dependent oxidoreductase n=1 Tax=Demequina lignilytica TaxID=3051663 RepID=A0AAW7M2P7_9MICO|nr:MULTISPECIES: FAD-dependent oxidoreductase [unclassified Demequina]MDN4477708.1 FAD-dependent oxidoreductase [Demequina sp. SYSU T00039-1]MDN4487617.1 FAD-dependent oxidoreductase [Demequina sp. SYSU T00039]
MRRLVILGAGTAGTIAANKLRRLLTKDEWEITIVDQRGTHYYQPAFLFIPFGRYRPDKARRKAAPLIPDGVTRVEGAIDRVDPDARTVRLADGRELGYEYLIIATGTSPHPEETPGMADDWHGAVHSFYTFDDAVALRDALAGFSGGRLVVHITEMPIKCPVAPLEFTLLADDYFKRRGIRDKVDITFVTPLSGAFTKPVAAAAFGDMLDTRGIAVEADYMIESIDPEARTLNSYDEREVPYDLLVTVPLNKGAEYVGRSGLGDELDFVTVDHGTLRHPDHPEIFAVGDAAAVPTSKAGAVAHFELDIFPENFARIIEGKEPVDTFDGHATCFIESGAGKAMLIDFNYTTEPLPGKFPVPAVGPLPLLKESRFNHWGKLAFEPVYWSMLLPGRPLPLPAHMSMRGKRAPA